MSKRLFKGKRVNGGGEVIGYHCKIGETITGAITPDGVRHYIIPENTTSLNGAIEVEGKSVTQHTGQTDRNGVDIWDNSHLRVSLRDKVRIGDVFYDKHLACHSVKFPDGQKMKFSEIFSAKNTGDIWIEVVEYNGDGFKIPDAVTPIGEGFAKNFANNPNLSGEIKLPEFDGENKPEGVGFRNGKTPYVTVIDHTIDETFPKSDFEDKPTKFNKNIKEGCDALREENPEIVGDLI